MAFITQLTTPSVDDFLAVRAEMGWDAIERNIAEHSLNNSLFHVTIYQEDKLIAMGRVVGDGAMFFYIQDIIVLPSHQGLGLGKLVMEEIEAYLLSATTKGSTIGLLSAKGKEGFYQRFGYLNRPSDIFGNGMCKFI